MEQGIQHLAMALSIGFGVFMPGISIGLIGSKAVDAVGRNPESANKVQTLMLLAIVFAESLAIFSLVIALMIKFV